MRILALFWVDDGTRNDWSLIDVHDVEAFLNMLPRARKRCLIALRQFVWTLPPGRCCNDAWRAENPHVMVTKGTKSGQSPASTAHLFHVVDDCGCPPRTIRSYRLVDLASTLDPELVAAAFGMDPQATLIHLADHIDSTRLPNPWSPR